MKKCVFLACLWIGGLGVSSLGATITITPHNGGGGWLLLDYTVDEAGVSPAAVGLTISLSHGALLAGLGDWQVDPAFNFFPEYANEHPWSYQIGAGHPFDSDGFPKSGFGVLMSTYAPYECFPPKGCEGDVNSDGRINIEDVMLVAGDWLMAGPNLWTDLNDDGVVNLGDAAVLNGYEAPFASGINFLALKIADGGAGFTNVTFGIDAMRGGAFAADGTPLTMILPDTYRLVIPEPATLGLLGLGFVLFRKLSR
ncbi:MAG: PEP-CTERM sorting domain-containing protein [Phycisphaerae bacterium]|nr:PEP-CTERM sorting domain-containing protein [Phycisphaerae bacterium]